MLAERLALAVELLVVTIRPMQCRSDRPLRVTLTVRLMMGRVSVRAMLVSQFLSTTARLSEEDQLSESVQPKIISQLPIKMSHETVRNKLNLPFVEMEAVSQRERVMVFEGTALEPLVVWV